MAANRAEIAVRIMRAATELNMATVAIYGREDRFSQHRWGACKTRPWVGKIWKRCPQDSGSGSDFGSGSGFGSDLGLGYGSTVGLGLRRVEAKGLKRA